MTIPRDHSADKLGLCRRAMGSQWNPLHTLEYLAVRLSLFVIQSSRPSSMIWCEFICSCKQSVIQVDTLEIAAPFGTSSCHTAMINCLYCIFIPEDCALAVFLS